MSSVLNYFQQALMMNVQCSLPITLYYLLFEEISTVYCTKAGSYSDDHLKVVNIYRTSRRKISEIHIIVLKHSSTSQQKIKVLIKLL